MTATAKVLDFNLPDTAKAVGGELAASSQELVIRLRGSAVTDVFSLEQAVLDRQTIGDAIKRVTEFFAPFKQMAHRLHKALCDRESEILAPLQQLDTVKRRAIADYRRKDQR